jgi:YesN/AraC family two-component response regulator
MRTCIERRSSPAYLAKTPADVIVSDMRMPGMAALDSFDFVESAA